MTNKLTETELDELVNSQTDMLIKDMTKNDADNYVTPALKNLLKVFFRAGYVAGQGHDLKSMLPRPEDYPT